MGIKTKVAALVTALLGSLLTIVGVAVPAHAAADCEVGYTCF
jgi:hypothetical protein